jgi:hypothetical protein
MILYAAARRRLAQAAPLAVLVPVLVALWALRDQLPTALPQNPPASASDPVISGHPALLAAQALRTARLHPRFAWGAEAVDRGEWRRTRPGGW